GRALAGQRYPSEKGRHIDDLARAALEKVPRRDLHPEQRRFHVHIDHLIEIVRGQVDDFARDAAAGVVDPDVEAAEALDGLATDAFDILAAGDVGDDAGDARRTKRLRFASDLIELLLAARDKRDVVSFAGQHS